MKVGAGRTAVAVVPPRRVHADGDVARLDAVGMPREDRRRGEREPSTTAGLAEQIDEVSMQIRNLFAVPCLLHEISLRLLDDAAGKRRETLAEESAEHLILRDGFRDLPRTETVACADEDLRLDVTTPEASEDSACAERCSAPLLAVVGRASDERAEGG